jgi:bifunctional oligoribonuclease and PAP phosphatase NrnA
MSELQTDTIRKIVAAIGAHQRFLVATHIRPDGDAIGSVLALTSMLRKLGKVADAYCQDPAPPSQEFLLGANGILHEVSDLSVYEVIILVDCGDRHRVGDALDAKLDRAALLINIDHHASSTSFGDIYWVEGGASSTCELLYDLSQEIPVELDETIASQLYTGVLMDTGSFRFANTSKRALQIAAALVDAGAKPAYIAEQVYDSITPNRLCLLVEVLGDLSFYADSRLVTAAITPEMYERTGTSPTDSESFINHMRSVKTVLVAILFRAESDGIVYASLRSKGDVDVAGFAQLHGGGGHRRAAACRVKGEFNNVRRQLTEEVLRYLGWNA